MQTITYSVPSIHCHHCVHNIQMELSDMEGVRSVEANAETKQVTVQFEEPATGESIEHLMSEINYPVVK